MTSGARGHEESDVRQVCAYLSPEVQERGTQDTDTHAQHHGTVELSQRLPPTDRMAADLLDKVHHRCTFLPFRRQERRWKAASLLVQDGRDACIRDEETRERKP